MIIILFLLLCGTTQGKANITFPTLQIPKKANSTSTSKPVAPVLKSIGANKSTSSSHSVSPQVSAKTDTKTNQFPLLTVPTSPNGTLVPKSPLPKTPLTNNVVTPMPVNKTGQGVLQFSKVSSNDEASWQAEEKVIKSIRSENVDDLVQTLNIWDLYETNAEKKKRKLEGILKTLHENQEDAGVYALLKNLLYSTLAVSIPTAFVQLGTRTWPSKNLLMIDLGILSAFFLYDYYLWRRKLPTISTMKKLLEARSEEFV